MVLCDTSDTLAYAVDPVPVVIDPVLWEELRAGLLQRARLLDAIQGDLYGPGTLLGSEVLPLGPLFADPAFLRPAVRIPSRGPQRLLALSCTLARGADDRWRVVRDRTDVPGGGGDALELRRALSHSAPSVYRSTELRRLHPVFEAARTALLHRSRSDDRAGRIVVLIDDEDHEHGFDHHRLANLLGAPAVNAADLVVADGSLTLLGPTAGSPESRVDTVVRLVPSAGIDPLDVGPGGSGVTGILEAARRGEVEILNPVGTGVLENPALRDALPDLCRHLLHEDLQIPGHREEDGYAPVACLAPELSETLAPRPVQVQVLLLATENGFEVLPGGTARTVDDGPAALKDVWVLTPEAAESEEDNGAVASVGVSASIPAAASADADLPQAPRLLTGGPTMTPSIGSDLFWFGRYLDRVDSTGRLLTVLVDVGNDLGSEHGRDARTAHRVLLRAVTDVTGTHPGMYALDRRDREQVRRELLDVVSDPRRPGTLAQSLQSLERTARSLRDLVSEEVWPPLTQMRRLVADVPDQADVSDVQTLRDLVAGAMTLVGTVSDSMPRHAGWELLQAGRRIERALGILALLRSCWGTPRPRPVAVRVATALASATDSSGYYRRTVEATMRPEVLLDLLLTDVTLPRSLAFQLAGLRESFQRLPEASHVSEARAHLADLTALVGSWDARELLRPAESAADENLLVGEFTIAIDTLRRLSDALEDEYMRVPESTSPWGFDDV
jgi:uncharacterized circularly permuted ATP-grasp superfamily protein/uncharacterized alpha-E superfamily protein